MSTTVIHLDANLAWRVARLGERYERRWLGICDDLDLTVESSTYQELMEDIGDTLDAVLLDLCQEGRLDDFLTRQGWRVVDGQQWSGVDPEELSFDLPFTPQQMTSRDLEASIHQQGPVSRLQAATREEAGPPLPTPPNAAHDPDSQEGADLGAIRPFRAPTSRTRARGDRELHR